MKIYTSLLSLMILLGGNSLSASNLNIDPQRQDTNLQRERTRDVQFTEDKNLQLEQTRDVQFTNDQHLQKEQTRDTQFTEDQYFQQERDINRL